MRGIKQLGRAHARLGVIPLATSRAKHVHWIWVLAIASGLAPTGCSSSSVAPPDIENTWQAPQGFEDDVPATCDDNRDLFAYDAQAPLDVQETSRVLKDGVTIIDLTYASPMGGRVPATLVVPDAPGPFAGTSSTPKEITPCDRHIQTC
jgi:hypothetical protein